MNTPSLGLLRDESADPGQPVSDTPRVQGPKGAKTGQRGRFFGLLAPAKPKGLEDGFSFTRLDYSIIPAPCEDQVVLPSVPATAAIVRDCRVSRERSDLCAIA